MRGFELPYIVHWEGYHYMVVYGVSSGHVWVADPAIGFRKLSVEEFERGWKGMCLTFTPRQDMAQVGASRSPWVRFAGYLLPYKKILLHPFMATIVIQILGLVPLIFIYFAVEFLFNVKRTVLLIAFVVPTLAWTVLMTPKVKSFRRAVFRATTDANAYLMEALGGAERGKGMGVGRPVRMKGEKKYV